MTTANNLSTKVSTARSAFEKSKTYSFFTDLKTLIDDLCAGGIPAEFKINDFNDYEVNISGSKICFYDSSYLGGVRFSHPNEYSASQEYPCALQTIKRWSIATFAQQQSLEALFAQPDPARQRHRLDVQTGQNGTRVRIKP